MLEDELRERAREREILLMTHIVLGYPSLDESLQVVESMVEAGVDLVELQIPFSEPIADGPVILRANQAGLQAGCTVDACFEAAQKLVRRFDVPFLFMTYYNVLFQRGVERFAKEIAERGLRGAIVPDLPPEEAHDYLAAMDKHGLCPIFNYSPNTSDARMAMLARHGRGFVYCVARKGVTGRRPTSRATSPPTSSGAGRPRTCRWPWASASRTSATSTSCAARQTSPSWVRRPSASWRSRASRASAPSFARCASADRSATRRSSGQCVSAGEPGGAAPRASPGSSVSLAFSNFDEAGTVQCCIVATGGPEEVLAVERLSEAYGVPVNVHRLDGNLTICVPRYDEVTRQ